MMYEDFGYEELSDMPEMVTMLETGLMSQTMGRRSARQYVTNFYNTRMEDWKWDEYDEIWGFGIVPEDCPECQLNVDGLRNRIAGIPAQLEEEEHASFFARMEKRARIIHNG
eukprot:10607122-Heterocapsa_arctica.AAC.1